MTAYSTIPSYGTVTISQAFSVATNVEFLNDAGTGGVVIFSRGAIGVSLTGSPGSYTSSTAYFGGSITNFLPQSANYPGIPGDQVSIQAFTSLFNAMDIATTVAADNAAFDGQLSFAAHNYGGFSLVNGTVIPGLNSGFTLNANETQIIDGIALDLFGTAAHTATLELSFAYRTNPNSNHPFIDAVIKPVTAINETAANPCFAAGTRILTTQGEIAVENLAIGDLVITPEGEEQPIIWIGLRRLENLKAYRRPEAVRPIIIEAGALADNMPARNLVLSPDHAILLDGVLVPAKELLNWNNIHQDQRIDEITYYHIELPCHGIIFAESTPTESYLDTGHRGAFDNDSSSLIDHPSAMQQRRDTEACVPLCYGGPQLEAIRRRIANRQLGIRLASG